MKSGATLGLEWDTKKLALSDMMAKKYNILCKGRKIYKSLTESEYFNIMEDLAIQYYQMGSPHPNDLETETYPDYYLEEN